MDLWFQVFIIGLCFHMWRYLIQLRVSCWNSLLFHSWCSERNFHQLKCFDSPFCFWSYSPFIQMTVDYISAFHGQGDVGWFTWYSAQVHPLLPKSWNAVSFKGWPLLGGCRETVLFSSILFYFVVFQISPPCFFSRSPTRVQRVPLSYF